MKMVVAVVRDEFAATLTERLTQKGFGATKLSSTGGFLKAGNTTFLIGVPAAQLDEAMGMIRDACPPKPSPNGDAGAPRTAGTTPAQGLPFDVAVGGATVFVLDVERMIKV